MNRPPGDAPRGDVEVRGTVDEHRRLASELQSDRCEMLRGGGHDYRTDFSSAGIEDVIERLLQQLCRLLRSSLNHAERLRVHVPCDEVRHHAAGVRRQLRWFHAHAIACGDRVRHRLETEQHRIVPRRDDERHAFRLGDCPADCGLQQVMHRLGMPRRPPAEARLDEANLIEHQPDFHQRGLRGGFAQVGAYRTGDDGGILPQHSGHRVELRLSPAQWPGDS